jgi:hypothetical protein
MPASIFRRAFTMLTLVLIASAIHAQSTTPTKIKRRPNIPGSIILDFGFNGTQGAPDLWNTRLIGSHSLNIYYQYPLRFGRSKFSFNPGIGLSFERFKWKNSIILTNPAESGTTQHEKYEFAKVATLFGTGTSQKVTFAQNYIDVPIEIRFDSKPEDISRSFNIAFGARGGWLFDSFQKVKYKEDGQTKKNKSREDWGLTQLRYGLYTRVGIGGFNMFAFYNLTPLFQTDKGPYDQGTVASGGAPLGGTSGTTLNTFTIGLSLNGF